MIQQNLEDSNASPTIKQVEFNTIAASFGGLSTKTADLHKYELSSFIYSWGTNRSLDISQRQDIKVSFPAHFRSHLIFLKTLAFVDSPPVCVLHMMLTTEPPRHIQHASSSSSKMESVMYSISVISNTT